MMLSLLLCACVFHDGAGFDEQFTGRTLRYDYYHSGNATEEHVSPDRVRLEGAWAGSRVQLVDTTNLGKYLFAVVDVKTHTTLYSRGFASIYGEWETTGEAKRVWRSFHESLRFPEPKSAFQIVLRKRAADGAFREIHAEVVDPGSRFVERSTIRPRGTVATLMEGGPVATQVDLLLLASGYTAEEGAEFQGDCDRLLTAFFETEPFLSRKADFNVRSVHVPAAESGISNPRKSVWRDDPLGLSFNAFDSDRYVLTYANRELREIAAQAAYDAIVIVFNDRKYGGGGIFNLWSTCAAQSKEAPYLFVHEFGHSFGGLADEYYSSQVSYEEFNQAGVEPWEPNVTALLDPDALKWADLVEPETPLPTTWQQATYDEVDLEYQKKRQELRASGAAEEAAEALFDEVRNVTRPLLQGEAYYGKVGAFEGAAYQGKGMYRSEVDCIMFTRNPKHFCRVCRRSLEAVIDTYTR